MNADEMQAEMQEIVAHALRRQVVVELKALRTQIRSARDLSEIERLVDRRISDLEAQQ